MKRGPVRLGICGFGRTGRAAARIALEDRRVCLAAINSRASVESHAYLLKYDSVYGRFPHQIRANPPFLYVDNKKIFCFQEEDPSKIPWERASVDIVIEATGKIKKRDLLVCHLKNGAKKVIVAYPLPEADKTIVLGVNHQTYSPQKDQVISNASCTTNCLAVICKVLDEQFKIKRGCATTCHAVTMSQRLLDGSSRKDRRKGRAAFLNIIPTTTGATKTLALVLPHLAGKVTSLALRVPVADGSIIDLVVETKRKATKEKVIATFEKAAKTPSFRGILGIAEDKLVSQDIVGRSFSAIFDPALVQVIEGNLVKVFAWYDNEWGYSQRLIDLAFYLFKKGL